MQLPIFHRIFIALLLLSVFSCTEDKNGNGNKTPLQLTKAQKMEISQNSLKKAIEKEQEQIQLFITRQSLPFEELPSGIHLLKTDSNPSGQLPVSGQIIQVTYSLKLLDGKVLKSDVQENVAIDYQNKESGFFEAIKQLREHEGAIIIIPSYRAHGLAGDDAEIPPLSTLVYQIKIDAFL